jgi:hypothetical protein
MNFFDNCGTIDGEYLNICRINQFPLKKHFLITVIQQNEQYRPDLVSYRLFQNVNYGWILDEMNNFYHGFKDYTSGREIFYLKKEDLETLGLIR